MAVLCYMDMVENTRVPANTDVVDQARDLKDEFGDTWSDVIAFYVDHRGESVAEQVDSDDLRERLDRIEQRAEEATTAAQNAESAASEVKGRMDR